MERHQIPENFFNGAFDPNVISKDQALKNSLNLTSKDLNKFAPQAKLIVFDQCYNGSFQKDNYLTGAYLFDDDSNTIVAIANSINVLQDKWALQHFEQISNGKMIGEIHLLDNYLESHLFGDPTFRFERTFNNNQPSHISCFNQLKVVSKKLKNALLIQKEDQIIKKALKSNCEALRKLGTIWAYKTGKNIYIGSLVKKWFTDESNRIRFQAKLGLGQFEPALVQQISLKFIQKLPSYIDKSKLKKRTMRFTESNKKWLYDIILKRLEDINLPQKKRLSAIRTLRNYHFNAAIKFLLQISSNDRENHVIRTAAVEALGWYHMHKRRFEILEGLKSIKGKQNTPEIYKTIKRLETGANNLFTP